MEITLSKSLLIAVVLAPLFGSIIAGLFGAVVVIAMISPQRFCKIRMRTPGRVLSDRRWWLAARAGASH